MKNFMTVRTAGHQDIEEKRQRKIIYNEIMAFINQSIPKRVKTVRNKRLASILSEEWFDFKDAIVWTISYIRKLVLTHFHTLISKST